MHAYLKRTFLKQKNTLTQHSPTTQAANEMTTPSRKSQRLNAPWAARTGWTASHPATGCSLEAMGPWCRSWGSGAFHAGLLDGFLDGLLGCRRENNYEMDHETSFSTFSTSKSKYGDHLFHDLNEALSKRKGVLVGSRGI